MNALKLDSPEKSNQSLKNNISFTKQIKSPLLKRPTVRGDRNMYRKGSFQNKLHSDSQNNNTLQHLDDSRIHSTYNENIKSHEEFKINLQDIEVSETYSPILMPKNSDRSMRDKNSDRSICDNSKPPGFRINLHKREMHYLTPKNTINYEEKGKNFTKMTNANSNSPTKNYSYARPRNRGFRHSSREESNNINNETIKHDEISRKKQSVTHVIANLREQLTKYNKTKDHEKKHTTLRKKSD